MPPVPGRRRRLPAALAALALALGTAPLPAAAGEVTVFAAASLTNALDRIGAAFAADTGHRAVMAFGASSALARQIQEGAPADVFISASVEWMDAIAASGDLREETRRDLLGNTLVLIAHGRDVPEVTIDGTLDLVGLLAGGRLSMAVVDAVPAGVYGKAALTALGLWERVAPFVVESDNVRAALAFVALGEAPLGIVYATDAAVADEVSVIGTFPAGSHPPIVYPAGLTTGGESPAAAAFLDYLGSEAAGAIWREFGFRVLD